MCTRSIVHQFMNKGKGCVATRALRREWGKQPQGRQEPEGDRPPCTSAARKGGETGCCRLSRPLRARGATPLSPASLFCCRWCRPRHDRQPLSYGMIQHGGVLWCAARANDMAKKRRNGQNAKKKKDGMVRASSSYPRELYRILEEIALEKKVSIAWVMRDAAEKYVGGKWPLFRRSE